MTRLKSLLAALCLLPALALVQTSSVPLDGRLKKIADSKAIANAYRTDALLEIFGRWFGGLGWPDPVLEVMYALGRLPE